MKSIGYNVKFFFALFIYILSTSLAGQSKIILHEDLSLTNINESIRYLEDPKGTLTINDILTQGRGQWQVFGNNSLGYSSSSFWFEYEIENPFDRDFELTYEVSPGIIYAVDIYIVDPEGVIESISTGSRFPFDHRKMKHYNFANKLSIPAKSSLKVLTRLHSTTILIPKFSLLAPDQFWAQAKFEAALYSFYFGMIMVMVIYNFFLFISIKEVSYLHYVCYVGTIAWIILCMDSISYQLVFSDQWAFHETSVLYALLLACFFLVSFSMNFLEIKTFSNRLHLICRSFCFIVLATSIAPILLDHQFASFVILPFVIMANIITLLLGITAYKNKIPGAVYFLCAIAMAILGNELTIGLAIGIFPNNYVTRYAVHIGSALEVVMFAFALANKIKVANQEVKARGQKLEHTYEQLEKVFYPHQIAMIEDGHQLEQTMATNSGRGIVICFDVIASSSLKHYALKDFFDETIHECLDLLTNRYDKNKQISNGYRIKEMGDGFLCSIDYPFKVPSDTQATDLAIELSHEFVRILEKQQKKFHIGRKVFCGIGIAIGGLQGYYPSTGTKEYDIYGRGIILATRYEQMRKILFPSPDSHIIILQSDVYHSATEATKDLFEKHPLGKDLIVRDEPDATKLYYRLIPFTDVELEKDSQPTSIVA